MSLVSLKCKNCGSGLNYNDDAQMVTCNHCGSTFMLSELLDEKDLNFIKANQEVDVEKKMEVGNLLKQAETLMFQAEYGQAEELFKKVIELDDKNYKGYFGVVKAKTNNFNKVPDNNDYAEYAKMALKYVDMDEKEHVKAELDKLEILIQEEKIRLREILSADKQKQINEASKRANEKFFSKITYFLILFITAVILVFVVMTGTKTEKPPEEKSKTYEITTASGLLSALADSNGMSSTIILKNDIDFADANWTPVGTKQKPFSGKFYGNDFTISNLNVILSGDEGENYTGLFGYMKNAYIYKLKLDNVDITSDKYVDHQTIHNIGFICGYAENSSIKYCEVKETCDLSINHYRKSTLTVGGIAGKVTNSTISNSCSNAKQRAVLSEVDFPSGNLDYYFGGLVGYFNSSNIIQSYSKSNIYCIVTSENEQEVQIFAGGILGCNVSTNSASKYIKNCYFTGKIDSSIYAVNKHYYIAGIVAYGANQNSLQNNIVLNKNSFLFNDSPVEAESFFDYSTNESVCTYYADEDDFNIKLEILINSQV